MERLIILKDLLPIGSRSNVLSDLCNSKFICDKNKDVVFIDWKNLVTCPDSGRPYCGFTATIENNKIMSVNAGYPCH